MGGNLIVPLLRAVSDRAAVAVRALAFWTAVLLPLLYVPLVLLEHSALDGWLLLQLVSLNVAAIVLGHGHTHGEEL